MARRLLSGLDFLRFDYRAREEAGSDGSGVLEAKEMQDLERMALAWPDLEGGS